MLKSVSRILVIRTDKIGDVVLSTPALQALREVQSQAKISLLVNKNVFDVVANDPNVDQILSFDPSLHTGIFGFLRLVQIFRKEKFQVVVVLQANFWVVFAAFLARIPYRIGPLSKIWSWGFFNMGIRQIRSNVDMHEAEYNLQLMRDLGVVVSRHRYPPKIFVDSRNKKYAEKFFEQRGLSRKFKTIALHPGMGGSALNWPEMSYVKLGRILNKQYNLIITGGAAEEELVKRIEERISIQQHYDPHLPILTKYIGKDSLSAFMAIVNECDAMVAPSTGPMHMAVALGKKVVTVFSPIRVQSALRWGPYGVFFGTSLGVSPGDMASVLVPDVNCAENFHCALHRCMYYPCMPRISASDVATQLRVLLEGGGITMIKGHSATSTTDYEDLQDDFTDDMLEGNL